MQGLLFFNCHSFADNLDDIEDALEAGSAFLAQVGAKDLKQSVSMLSGGCPSGTVLLYLGAESADLDAVRKDFHVESRHVPGILKGQHRLRKCFCILIDGASSKRLLLELRTGPLLSSCELPFSRSSVGTRLFRSRPDLPRLFADGPADSFLLILAPLWTLGAG